MFFRSFIASFLGKSKKEILKMEELAEEEKEKATVMNRKEKRKEKKKLKRKQVRRNVAEKAREEEEQKMNDPEEQRRLQEMEEMEKEKMEKDRREFEEREKKWFEEMERKRKEEEEEERRKAHEEEAKTLEVEKENQYDEDDDWEYVEEGPAEIIWQGNEIIVRKKKVRVPKRSLDEQSQKEDADRPTSNPLPPQSEAFAEYQNGAMVSAQQMLENVAQQVPNFGTEQDKAHCPFHLKTGACRFGQRCSRVHFYPDKACTLLIKNMYNGPGLAWEQDEGLECTDEEVERSYEEFYEDVHTEFLKYGEIVNFKVCRNSSFHLRGNVYVHYKSLDSALLAYHSINGRYFAGKQVSCEFVNVTRWKVAICGEYMKSRLRTCSRGMACNFIHCFHNPGGDYEWADWDKPPPRYWVKKMAALFGYSDESVWEGQMDQGKVGHLRMSSKRMASDIDRQHTRRSRSREVDQLIHIPGSSSGSEDDVQEGSNWKKYKNDDRKQAKVLGETLYKDNRYIKGYHTSKSRGYDSDGEGTDRVREKQRGQASKSSKKHSRVSDRSSDYRGSKKRTHGVDSNEEQYNVGRKRQTDHDRSKSPAHQTREDGDSEVDGHHLHRAKGREKRHNHVEKTSRQWSKAGAQDDLGDDQIRTTDAGSYGDKGRDRRHYLLEKSSGHRENCSPNDYWDDRQSTGGAHSNDGKDHHQARKRSRCSELEFSSDERVAAKRLIEKPHSGQSEMGKSRTKGNSKSRHSSRQRSVRENNKADSLVASMNVNAIDKFNHVDQYSGRLELHDLGSRYNIFYQDRWEPGSPERA